MKSDDIIIFNEDFNRKNFKIVVNLLDYEKQTMIDDLILKK